MPTLQRILVTPRAISDHGITRYAFALRAVRRTRGHTTPSRPPAPLASARLTGGGYAPCSVCRSDVMWTSPVSGSDAARASEQSRRQSNRRRPSCNSRDPSCNSRDPSCNSRIVAAPPSAYVFNAWRSNVPNLELAVTHRRSDASCGSRDPPLSQLRQGCLRFLRAGSRRRSRTHVHQASLRQQLCMRPRVKPSLGIGMRRRHNPPTAVRVHTNAVHRTSPGR